MHKMIDQNSFLSTGSAGYFNHIRMIIERLIQIQARMSTKITG